MRVIGDKNQISADVFDFMISYLPFPQKSVDTKRGDWANPEIVRFEIERPRNCASPKIPTPPISPSVSKIERFENSNASPSFPNIQIWNS